MAIEIVDFPMKNGWIFHSYVSLPEGICKVFIAFPGKTSFKKTEKTEKAGKWENMGAQATFMMAIPRCQRLQEVFFHDISTIHPT